VETYRRRPPQQLIGLFFLPALNYHPRDSGLVRKDQTRIFEIPGTRCSQPGKTV
jgi:hypothetical protein